MSFVRLTWLVPLVVMLSSCGTADENQDKSSRNSNNKEPSTLGTQSSCCDPAERPDDHDEPPMCCGDGSWQANFGDGDPAACDEHDGLGKVCEAPSRCASADASFHQARALWGKLKFAHYRYRYTRSCECLPEDSAPVIIEVANDQIAGIEYTDGTPVNAGKHRLYNTVDGLFDKICAAFEQDAFSIAVTYDDTMGYPTDIRIDYQHNVADEELLVRTSDLAKLSDGCH